MDNFVDIGLKEIPLVEGAPPLHFSPSDPNVYARYFDALDAIKAVEKEAAHKAVGIDENDVAGRLRLMREADLQMKEILNGVFGCGSDIDKSLYGVNLLGTASNNKMVLENLLEHLSPIMVSGAKAIVGTEVQAAKLNREQRRAIGK